jgi:hypothetical protein
MYFAIKRFKNARKIAYPVQVEKVMGRAFECDKSHMALRLDS